MINDHVPGVYISKDYHFPTQVQVGLQEQFWLSFIGTVGNNFQGDIAIDDLKFIDCRVGKQVTALLRTFH